MSRLVAAFAAASFMAVAAVVAPSCASGRSVVFFAPWDGGDAWLVNYTGPFENDRPPHVQVGKDQIKNHTAGEFYCLDNIHVVGKSAIEWDVVGCYNSALKQGAHMTCYYGPNAKSKINDFRDPAPPAHVGVTCDAGTYYKKYGPDCGADCCPCIAGNYCPGGTPKQEMFPCPTGECSPAGASAKSQCAKPACAPGPGPSPGPAPADGFGQVHLALTGRPSEMAVSFAVPNGACRGAATVAYGTAPGALTSSASAPAVPFSGGGQTKPLCTYVTTLTGLRNNTVYYYSIEGGETFSFTNQKDRAGGRVYALLADMGVVNDQAAAQLAYEAANDVYDAVIYGGDLAYDLKDNGGANGDAFMDIMQPVAALKPWMVVVGNHEEYFNFSSFKARFSAFELTTSPNSGSDSIFWYSFNDGLVHFVNINTEVFQYGGADPAAQYAWLEADLAAVDRRATPWIVAQGHKNAFMSQTVFTKFDSLFRRYGVNLYLNGHAHNYQHIVPFNKDLKTPDACVKRGSSVYKGCSSYVNCVVGSPGNREISSGGDSSRTAPKAIMPFFSENFGFAHLTVNSTALHLQWEQVKAWNAETARFERVAGAFMDELWIVQ